MKISALIRTIAAAGLLAFALPNVARAGGYNTHRPATKTTVRTYTRTVPSTVHSPGYSSGGTYCLHEPGDDYGLSYGGCDYDGGYGGQTTNVYVRGGGTYYHGGGIILRTGGGFRHAPKRIYKH